jgi:hypothetical protein
MATEYKGWRIDVHTDQATDAEGSQRLDAPWRVYVRIQLLERRRAAGGVLDHVAKSDRTFPSREAAESAAIAMAEMWIDNQGGGSAGR